MVVTLDLTLPTMVLLVLVGWCFLETARYGLVEEMIAKDDWSIGNWSTLIFFACCALGCAVAVVDIARSLVHRGG